MRKIGLSELSRLGFEIRSTSYVYPKTGQLRKTYNIVRKIHCHQSLPYVVLTTMPRGYEVWFDEKNSTTALGFRIFIKKKLNKDPFPKLVEKRYPNHFVEAIDNA